MTTRRLATLLAWVALASAPALADVPLRNPDAVIDLATKEGVALVHGEWRYHDAQILEVDHRKPGPDKKASGEPNRTHDIEPKAGVAGFDDSSWPVITPESLEDRRSSGRLAFSWYRLSLTLPEKVGGFPTQGSTVVFEIVMDDYAEIWIDGKLPQVLGQTGGHLVRGWNCPQRTVVARNAQPGQKVELAVFAMNGPVSSPPGNFIWVRSATLDFHSAERFAVSTPVEVKVIRKSDALDQVLPKDLCFERLASGFQFIEGPVWMPDGYLLFSDPNANLIYRFTPDGELSVYRTKSGYKGLDIKDYGQPGSNGLALDLEGRLLICEHGNRRVTRLEKNGTLTVLADRFEGKRLNSPNDLVMRSDGALYFSDPPFGLPRFHDDKRRELDHFGIYCLKDGNLRLVDGSLLGPNGLAFSPEEGFLYSTNWDENKKYVTRYSVNPDGSLSPGEVFFDMGSAPEPQALDGIKVDLSGNLYISGPGGMWILSKEGEHLGTIVGPELPANMAFGDEDGRTLYLTARTGLYRMRVMNPGRKAASTRP